jgi:hypothetical protein
MVMPGERSIISSCVLIVAILSPDLFKRSEMAYAEIIMYACKKKHTPGITTTENIFCFRVIPPLPGRTMKTTNKFHKAGGRKGHCNTPTTDKHSEIIDMRPR